ncbi:MAG: CBS domain-containing protein [Candidatus Saccharimonadales bacterium]
MLSFVFGLILAAVMYVFIALDKTYNHVTAKELKRRARDGDDLASLLFKAVAHGQNLQLVLLAGIVLSAAAAALFFATAGPSILGFILVVLLIGLGFLWLPSRRLTPLASRLTIWSTPPLAKFLYYCHRPLHFINTRLLKPSGKTRHTRIYTPEDLIEFLDRQKSQGNSRIMHDDLAAAELALKFNDKKVSHIKLPPAQLKTLNFSEKLTPRVIDELHLSGQTEYLVYDGKKSNIVGLVSLADLVANVARDRKISELMHADLAYIHEDFALGQALQAFYKTKQTAFVVINSSEKYCGLITLQSIVAELAGPLAKSSFENYEDKSAVAHALDAKAEIQEMLDYQDQDTSFESVEVVE